MPIRRRISGHGADRRRSRCREPRIFPPLRRARFPSAGLRRTAAGCAIRRPRPARGARASNRPGKRSRARATVHSYSEVHHAIQPAFRGKTPYLILLVDLDTQKGEPTPDEALRVVGNLTTPDGQLAPPELVQQVGIGIARADGVQRCRRRVCRCRNGRSTRPRRSRTSPGATRRNSPRPECP